MSRVMNVFGLLLISKFRSFGVDELKDFVPSLFHYSEPGKISISNDKIWSFKVNVNSGLEASGFESDVGKYRSRECI